jgi:glycosyltransferase involved in cell wall biosynthesis
VRIAIEVLGTQSESRFRGVGRYTHELVNALLDLGTGHEFILHAQAGAPSDYIPGADRAEVRWLEPDPARGERTLSDVYRRLLGTNADRIDLLLLCNPSELRFDYLPPSPPLNGVKMAAVMYDLIPLIFSEHYFNRWPAPEYVRQYVRGLDRLRRYDGFLAISDSTRDDVIAHLGVRPDRVVNIGTGGDAAFFKPDPTDLRDLAPLGIDGRFVFSMGAMEFRKNIWGLVDAFAGLPDSIKSSHQLVLTYNPNEDEADRVRSHANSRGVLDRIVLTGRMDDSTLRTLYRRCAAFVFPSRYEGFGFPALEAMLCGAPTIAGNNSSQIEIVGDAGLLVDAGSAEDLRAKMEMVLNDGDRAGDFRRRAPIQGAQFAWKRTAERAVAALDGLKRGRSYRVHQSHARKPRIAFFSPLPPMLSGISDYSIRLIEALKAHYTIDLYHDSDYMPGIKLNSLAFACHDHRLFRRHAAILGYHACLYQMGNSPLHNYIYKLLPDYPGPVTLHDFSLAGFRYWDAMVNGRGHDDFRGEIAGFDEQAAVRYGPMLDRWSKLPGGVVAACAREGLFLNQRIFAHATGMIFHSPWCVGQAERLYPAYPGRMTVVPYGANVAPVAPERKAALRAKYGLPQDIVIVGNFGLIHSTKMNVESLRAFKAVAERDPEALFVLVGPEYDDNASRECVAALGLERRVRYLGAKPAEEFAELVAASDIGLNLRRPPTNGETSSSLLDLLRQGIPAVITDVGTFSDFPEVAVRKIPWADATSQDLLTRTVLDLAASRAARDELGASAVQYVRDQHSWSRVAELYAQAIEASLPAGRGDRATPARGPHFRMRAGSRAERPSEGREAAR